MSQYTTGSVDVVGGSSTVTGLDTAWLTEVESGHVFVAEGDTVSYTVSGVTDDDTLTLTAPYGGSTRTTAYAIHRDFTPNRNIPILSPDDLESWEMFNLLGRIVDILSGGDGGGGTWGTITGTLSSQTDLQTALNTKAPISTDGGAPSLGALNLSVNRDYDPVTLSSTNTTVNLASASHVGRNAAIIPVTGNGTRTVQPGASVRWMDGGTDARVWPAEQRLLVVWYDTAAGRAWMGMSGGTDSTGGSGVSASSNVVWTGTHSFQQGLSSGASITMTGGASATFDFGAGTVKSYLGEKREHAGTQTLSVANFPHGATIMNGGGTTTYTVPSRLSGLPNNKISRLEVLNRGGGEITFSASGGVVLRGNGALNPLTDGNTATLLWERDVTSGIEYCWIWHSG